MLELFENDAIWGQIAILISAVSVTISYFIKRQKGAELKTKNQISSAERCKQLLRDWEIDGRFSSLRFTMIHPDSNIDQAAHHVNQALTSLEYMSTLWHDKTLIEDHVKEFFGPILNDINNNNRMNKIMKDLKKKSPDHHLTNLDELLKETKKWNIKSRSFENTEID